MKYFLEKVEEEIKNSLKNVLDDKLQNIQLNLEKPPENMGDYAFPCFPLASVYKKSPIQIAEDLCKKIKKSSNIEKIDVNGGYLNFFIDSSKMKKQVSEDLCNNKETFGFLEKKNKKVIVEHTSANPNGPLHVGRARNPIVGDTVARILKAAGFTVETQFYVDDMGKQVAILAWGKNNLKKQDIPKNENDKPDHQMVGFYQKANELMDDDFDVAAEIEDIVKKSEEVEPDTIKLVHEAYQPVLEGIIKSLKDINVEIDNFVPESKFVKDKSVKKVIDKLMKSKFCGEEDGAFYLDLESFGVKGRNTKFFFLRKDGTSLYATRDIAYHLWKAKKADKLVNILGEDHKLESKQVEIALRELNAKILPFPIFYSFVSMPGGKMSTRRGRVVYLDDLIDEITRRAYKEVKKRRNQDLTDEQMKEIAEKIGVGSVRYNIIKVQPEKDIVFKWEEALNFEGNASPFIQYSHARCCGILSKSKDEFKITDFNSLTHDSEIKLIKKIAEYPLTIKEASEKYKPHLLTSYLFDLASVFNQFYRDCPVLIEENNELRCARLKLVDATRIIFKNGLKLLGIESPEEM